MIPHIAGWGMYMITVNDFCKKEYGRKLYKICFDAGMTCPNRDGTISTGGCIFCSEGGSGDFAVDLRRYRYMAPVCVDQNTSESVINLKDLEDIEENIRLAKVKVSAKYKGDRYIAYFQAFTNTYAPLDELRNLYMNVINRSDIAVLSIATRPDCLNEGIYELISELKKIKPVWIELGLQSSKEESIEYIKRGYPNSVYLNAVKRLKEIGVHIITHVILYLPGENKEDMLNTIRFVAESGSDGIKLQLLHILKNTGLEKDYKRYISKMRQKETKSGFDITEDCEKGVNDSIKDFVIPSLDEYADFLKEAVAILPDGMVVHRLTGDPPKNLLIEPKWAANKKKVLNAINEALIPSGKWYVYILKCGDGSLYTGSTNNVAKRFRQHSSGKGCKYTKSHLPVELVYTEELENKQSALRREYAIKQFSRADKLKLIKSKTN